MAGELPLSTRCHDRCDLIYSCEIGGMKRTEYAVCCVQLPARLPEVLCAFWQLLLQPLPRPQEPEGQSELLQPLWRGDYAQLIGIHHRCVIWTSRRRMEEPVPGQFIQLLLSFHTAGTCILVLPDYYINTKLL